MQSPDLSNYDLVLPGMPNVHSHAFQRAMAGLTEWRSDMAGKDNFWTWRALMYRFAGKITPEQLRIIARWLYIELLKGGYTHVGEFHYLHHQPGGVPYADPAELSYAILEAAHDVGIGLTLLPVLYATSDFGGKAPSEGQKRFVHDTEDFLKLVDKLQKPCQKQGAVLGVAPHSLRAVTPEMLRDLLGGLRSLDLKHCPKHIHAAEQRKEVDACMDWSGKRPVEWLLDHLPIDESWTFIHATHMSESEIELMAQSGAVAGLCPSTEANLGDGIFPAVQFLREGGRFAVGGDSHVSVQAHEELKQLETSQRLAIQQRVVLSHDKHVGKTLWHRAVAGGVQSLAVPRDGRGNHVCLRFDHPLLTGKSDDSALDTVIFALPTLPVQDVYVNDVKVIENGRHKLEEEAAEAFKHVMLELVSD